MPSWLKLVLVLGVLIGGVAVASRFVGRDAPPAQPGSAAVEGARGGGDPARQPAPAASAPGRSAPATPVSPLVFARGADSVKLDPADITDGESAKVCNNLYEGLLEYGDQDTKVQPCLAETWQVSADGRTYTFQLRAGVKFHDGTALDAAAVVDHFMRQKDPAHPHHFGLAYVYWESMFAAVVAGIESTGALEVRFTLHAAHAPFLANLAMFSSGIASPAALAKYGEEIARNPVGTGPYKFVHWLAGEEIVLERWDGYWRDKAKTPRVKFLSIADNSGRLQRMRQGEFQLMDGLSTDHYEAVLQTPALQLVRQPGMNVAYLSLNHRRPPFGDVRVRRAVCHALRKEVIASIAYGGHATVARNPMPPTLWGYNTALVDYPHDPDKARALLAEAGYDGTALELYVPQATRPYMPDPPRVAQLIVEDLAKVGMVVKIHPAPWEAHLKATQNAEHDMALLGWTGDNGDPDNFLYALLDKDGAKVGAANNISFYESDRLHEVLVAAQKETVQARRAELYVRAQEIIHEDVGFVPLVHTEDTMVMATGVQGYQIHPTGTVRLRGTMLPK